MIAFEWKEGTWKLKAQDKVNTSLNIKDQWGTNRRVQRGGTNQAKNTGSLPSPKQQWKGANYCTKKESRLFVELSESQANGKILQKN